MNLVISIVILLGNTMYLYGNTEINCCCCCWFQKSGSSRNGGQDVSSNCKRGATFGSSYLEFRKIDEIVKQGIVKTDIKKIHGSQ